MSANRQRAVKRPQFHLPEAERRSIAERFGEFVRERYKTVSEMKRELGVPHNTASGWLRSRPSIPKMEWLIRLARKKNLNLNWLLLGEGPPLRQPARHNVWSDLRETLVAELIAAGASARDAQRSVAVANQLHRYLVDKALLSLQRLEGSPRTVVRRQTIATAIQEVLDAEEAGLMEFHPVFGLVPKSDALV